MKITGTAIEEIRSVLTKPLEGGDLRHISAMGNLFVSGHKFPEDDNGLAITDNSKMDFWFQYSLKIDGVAYYFYGGTPIV